MYKKMYECVLYNYGSGIFNKENEVEIYENKKVLNTLIYFRGVNDLNPITNIYFTSISSMKRYIKNNKEMILLTS